MAVEVSGAPKSKSFFLWAPLALAVFLIWYIAPTVHTYLLEKHVGFTRMICDNAYQTEDNHFNDAAPYFDVKLTPGCFSGYVTLPSTWSVWQVQFRGYDPTDWYAKWLNGAPDPYPPIMIDTANGTRTDLSDTDGSRMMRLEGKGTLRFYVLVGRSPND